MGRSPIDRPTVEPAVIVRSCSGGDDGEGGLESGDRRRPPDEAVRVCRVAAAQCWRRLKNNPTSKYSPNAGRFPQTSVNYTIDTNVMVMGDGLTTRSKR